MRAVLAAVVAMYTIQGAINGLSDTTLPQLLNRGQDRLIASEILAIVKLPAALKVFLAPGVDWAAQKSPSGYKGLVLALQAVAIAAIVYIIPGMQVVIDKGGEAAAWQLRWPMFSIACTNAIGDLTLDAFTLQQVPKNKQHLPALCQVVGVFVGKTMAKSGLFLLMDWQLVGIGGFMWMLAGGTGLAAVAVAFGGSRVDVNAGDEVGLLQMLQNVWTFSTCRPNMPHWMLYQLMMPSLYFHAVTVLPSRYEQKGFQGEDYAAYDIPLAVATVIVLVSVSGAADNVERPLSFVLRAYFAEALIVLLLLGQYLSFASEPSLLFALSYSVLSKLQDLLFYTFELFEFAFYGQVAQLDPRMVATLVTMQASAFNFAEFFHCWLAPFLVDRFSACDQVNKVLACDFDAYPMVAAALVALGLSFLLTQWTTIQRYQHVGHSGWNPQAPLRRHQLLVMTMLVSIGMFTVSEAMQ